MTAARDTTTQRPMSTRTVIPVPELPTLDQTQPALRLEPVVRSRAIVPPPPPPIRSTAQAATPPRRFPRGTDHHAPPQPVTDGTSLRSARR
jgi:hypothetical protein